MGGQIGQVKKKEAIIESIAGGASRAAACRAAGVSRTTFYAWLRDDAVFRTVVERREAELVETVGSVTLACALKAEDDPRYLTALIWWEKTRAGFKDTLTVEHGIDDGASDTRESILSRIRELASGGGAGKGAGGLNGAGAE